MFSKFPLINIAYEFLFVYVYFESFTCQRSFLMLLCSLISFYSIPLKKRKAPFVCVLSGLRFSSEACIVILGQFNHCMASIQIKEKIERELTELLVGATMLHLY